MSSIFDSKKFDDEEILEEIINEIDIEEISSFILDSYCSEIGYPNYKFVKNKLLTNNVEKLEFNLNLIIYFSKSGLEFFPRRIFIVFDEQLNYKLLWSKPKTMFNERLENFINFINRNEVMSLNYKSINFILDYFNKISFILKNNNLKIFKYEDNKYKIINSDIKELTNEIKNLDWKREINLFFTEYKNNKNERGKILTTFANHIDGDVRNKIENFDNYFNKKNINDLIYDLNNIYKHFNSKSKEKVTNRDSVKYKNFINLSEDDQMKKMENDIYFIIYLLVEFSRQYPNYKFIKDKILSK